MPTRNGQYVPNITSPGRGISQRQQLESALGPALASELDVFYEQVWSMVDDPTATLSPTEVETAWAELVGRMEAKLRDDNSGVPPILVAFGAGIVAYLATSGIPDLAYSTARGVELTGLTGTARRDALRAAFQKDAPALSDPNDNVALLRYLFPDDTSQIDPAAATARKYLTPDESGPAYSWEAIENMEARGIATSSYNSMVIEALREEGYTHKMWITRRDDRVRPTHAAVDSAHASLTEQFQVGNDLLAYPRDPRGSTEEIAGCRCIIVGVA